MVPGTWDCTHHLNLAHRKIISRSYTSSPFIRMARISTPHAHSAPRAGSCGRGRRKPRTLARSVVPEECLPEIPRTHEARIDWTSCPPAGRGGCQILDPLDLRDGDRMEWDGTVWYCVSALREPASHCQCLSLRQDVLTRGRQETCAARYECISFWFISPW